MAVTINTGPTPKVIDGSFIGNKDYRGFLNYLGTTKNDSTASQLLKYVGNDAKFGSPGTANAALQARNAELYHNYKKLIAGPKPTRTPSMLGGGGFGVPAPVYAPKIDIAAINAQARKAARSAVAPLYQRRLNDMLARMKVKRNRANQDYTSNVEELEENLAEITGQNALTRERTGEDVNRNVGEINTAEDQFQLDAGTETDAARLEEARALASGGLLTSGAGRRKAEEAQQERVTTEERQTEQFQTKRATQFLMKARTFEDLAKSDVMAGQKTEKGKKQAKLSLSRMLQDYDYETKQNRQTLEQQQYEDLARQTQGKRSELVSKFIQNIRDAAQRDAAYKTYGSYI